MTGAEFDRVDLDLLADYVGGVLDGTLDEERVASLVAADPVWRAALAALEPGMSAVEAALRGFEPEPMPEELATRLDALFQAPATGSPGAADSPGTAGSPGTIASAVAVDSAFADGGTAPAVPANVVDLAKARRARRWAAPLAVAAAVLAFAGFGISQLVTPDSTADRPAATSAKNDAPNEAGPMVDAPPAVGDVVNSDTDYSAATLPDARANQPRIASGPSETPEPAIASAQKESALSRLAGPAELRTCLEEIARENGGSAITVEFVDYARFNGQPALIVRFTAANGAWVWAVGPACGTPGAGAAIVENLPVR